MAKCQEGTVSKCYFCNAQGECCKFCGAYLCEVHEGAYFQRTAAAAIEAGKATASGVAKVATKAAETVKAVVGKMRGGAPVP